MLTPDTLRYLGTTVERVTGQIREILLAAKATDMHVQLQRTEFARQQAKAKELVERVERLRGERQEITKAKLESVRDGQKALMTRIDRILGAMMRNASPEVSEHERRWFEELRRMKDEVVGRGRYDHDSLAARTSLVSVTLAHFASRYADITIASPRLGATAAQPEGASSKGGEAKEEDAGGWWGKSGCITSL